MSSDLTLPAPYTPHAALMRAFDACPLIAIMRGITPAEAADHGRALYEAG
ncbi:2-dehydro-3-deoxy-6-phosphogalactonate aldolase, partial [Burkholderia cepacia]